MGQWLPDSVEDPYNQYVAGPADHLAGSTDESVGRQFDDTPGGGFADVTANTFWSGASGLGDWAAGDVDETVQQYASTGSQMTKYVALASLLLAALAVVTS